jgi:3-hydroxybutyryl-CoA dehydrogenase
MAMILVIADQASIEEVDRAWMAYRKAPMGPFGMMDLFGLNVVYDGWQQPKSDPDIEKLKPIIIPFITPYIVQGELGIKTGKGFYTYPEPTYQESDFLDGKSDVSAPYDALIAALIQSAVLVALNGVAEPEDIDRAWMTATYLDIGPFGILDQMGVAEFMALLKKQVDIGLLLPENAALTASYLQQYHFNHQTPKKGNQT